MSENFELFYEEGDSGLFHIIVKFFIYISASENCKNSVLWKMESEK